MHADYADIIERLGEPIWYDEYAVPRYCRFEPKRVANIYAKECALVEILCQSCHRPFAVAFSWIIDDYEDGVLRPGRYEYGDPPRHDADEWGLACAGGDTMSSDSVRVIEFWRRDPFEWFRVPEREGAMI